MDLKSLPGESQGKEKLFAKGIYGSSLFSYSWWISRAAGQLTFYEEVVLFLFF